MYTLFLTGGIGAGKSTALAHLASRGARIISLDEVGHDVLRDPQVKYELAQRFGPSVLGLDSEDFGCPCEGGGILDEVEVDRAVLARLAFADEASTNALNAITHPRIVARMNDLLSDSDCTGRPQRSLTVVEVTAFAPQHVGMADEIMAIACPIEPRRTRACQRGMAPDDFERRNAAQLEEDVRNLLAHTVVDNVGTTEDLICQLDAWWDAREACGWNTEALLGCKEARVPGAPISDPQRAFDAGLHSPAVAFIGRHNSGKTTLVTKVIAELAARGVDVGSVKHHGHPGFEIDVPGKDSWRHRKAGASEVAIAAPDQFALVRTLTHELTSEEVVASMQPHDVIVVEGFRNSGVPSVEIMRAANDRDLACARVFVAGVASGAWPHVDARCLGPDVKRLPDEHCCAVATDIPGVMEAARSAGMWAFHIQDVAGIATFIEQEIMNHEDSQREGAHE